MRNSKFIDFENYLINCNEDYITLTFAHIEQILGFELSKSAYAYEAYWYLSPTHTFPNTWLKAGYKMHNLDIQSKSVSFQREEYSSNNQIKTEKHKQVICTYSKSTKAEIDVDFAIKKASKFLGCLNNDDNSRYLSWEHCYTSFANCTELTKEKIDNLCLHLAFYLASWGMYRGSSFLLQKDYKVHKEAVEELFNDKYKALWGINCSELLLDNNIDLVMDLSEKLKQIYIKKRKNLDEHEDVSTILITKILMGTLGCVPAYDRFFIDTIKTYKIASGNFNKNSLVDLAIFYNENRVKFDSFKNEVNTSRGLQYPEMKILDMSFWYIALEKDKK